MLTILFTVIVNQRNPRSCLNTGQRIHCTVRSSDRQSQIKDGRCREKAHSQNCKRRRVMDFLTEWGKDGRYGRTASQTRIVGLLFYCDRIPNVGRAFKRDFCKPSIKVDEYLKELCEQLSLFFLDDSSTKKTSVIFSNFWSQKRQQSNMLKIRDTI